MWAAPRPAPHIHSPSAPRLASFSTSTGKPSASSTACEARVPAQPGRIVELPSSPDGRCTGPGRPMPDADHLVAARPRPPRARPRTAARPARSPPWRADRRPAAGGARPAARARGPRSPAARGACRSRSRRPRRPCGAARSAPAGGRSVPRSGGCTGVGGLDDQPGGVQLADDRGHGRGRERGTAGEVGARHGAGLGQHADDTRASIAARRPFHRGETLHPKKCPGNKRRLVRC